MPRLGTVLEHSENTFFAPAMTPVEAINGHIIAGCRLVPVNGAGRRGSGRGLYFDGDETQHAEK